MHILLKTKRLILRQFSQADGEHLFALDNDPDVMRYINGGSPTPREIIESDILPRFTQYNPHTPIYGFWAAIEKESGTFIGWFSLRPKKEAPQEASLGYRLHKSAWGQGYATEGGRALIDKAFSNLTINRITATTYEENRASRRVMEKIGLTFHHAFRLTLADIINSDTSHSSSAEVWAGNDVEYALERSTWEKTYKM